LKKLDWQEYFRTLASWAKWIRIANDRPLYKDLTEEGIKAEEEKMFRGT